MDVVSLLSIAAGFALVVAVIVDGFVTVFVIGGGPGFISSRIADRIWRLAIRWHDPSSRLSHSGLRAVGPLVLLLALLFWLGGLVVGWALVFVPGAFEGPEATGLADRLLFSAQMIIGRGGNDPRLSLDGDGWNFVQVVASLSGIAVLSLGLAYVLPVLGAVAHRRSIASMVHAMGETVDEIRDLAARLEGGGQVELHLISLTPAISFTAERHRSYPVLHYFHSSELRTALAPAIAKLCLLVRDGFPEAEKVDESVIRPLARAVRELLEALSHMGLEEFAHQLDDPDCRNLSATPMNTDPDHGGNEVPPIGWLKAYVAFDGWEWDPIARHDREYTREPREADAED